METLVALALMCILMSSVSASIHLYWKYRSQSREHVSSSHILRGIIEDLTVDLRAVVRPPVIYLQMAADGTPGQSQANDSMTGRAPAVAGAERMLNVTEQVMTLNDMETASPVHFLGTKRSLAIFTQHSNPRFPDSARLYQRAQERHVVWWVHDGRPISLSLAHRGPVKISTAIAVPHGTPGLMRGILLFNSAGVGQQPDLHATSPAAIAVETLTFRYFDGSNWYAEWDSTQRLRLPDAVEVSLLLRDQPTRPTTFVISLSL